MAEKDNDRYRYEPYKPLASKQQINNDTSTLKRYDQSNSLKSGVAVASGTKSNLPMKSKENPKRCCNCIGPKATSFWFSVLTNLGICTLLFGYTLLGSFIFLAIEGGASTMQQRTLASTNRHRIAPARINDNVTLSEAAVSDAAEARQKTVENIWDITVSLNILYRENWTR